MQPKLLKDQPIDEYHDLGDLKTHGADGSVSKTMLSVYADDQRKFKHQFIDGNRREETPSLALGKAVHTLALEPQKWKSEYIIVDCDRRTKAGKEEWAEALETGKNIIKSDQMEQIEGMANALAANPVALALLKADGYVEASILWDDNGLPLRCRPDFLRNDGLIVDLKTARNVKPSLFFKDALNFHYDLSVALTMRGYEALYGKPADNYVFLCIESTAPYCIECFESMLPMDDTSGMSYLDYGEARLYDLLDGFRVDWNRFKATGEWPLPPKRIETMNVPAWAMNKMLSDGE